MGHREGRPCFLVIQANLGPPALTEALASPQRTSSAKFNQRTACQLVVDTAIEADPRGLHGALEAIRAPLDVTDRTGTLTYFNPACITLAGRTPQIGAGKWCVTWKLFTTE